MRFVRRTAFVVSMCALACNRPPQTLKAPEFRGSIAGIDWALIELGGKPAPTGAGGQRATIHFDADSGHVFGFAGCNRFAGAYSVQGQDLHFPPLAMTKMACTEGMDLEQRFADALTHTNRYELNAAGLTFFEGSTPLARFTRQNQ